jgi:sodium/bile acid cotransporter 7
MLKFILKEQFVFKNNRLLKAIRTNAMKRAHKGTTGRHTGLTLMLLCAVIVSLVSPLRAAETLTNDQKRQEIEELYSKYKEDFSDVPDIDPREAILLSQQQKVIFIDIRDSQEQDVSMLPGAITEAEFLKNTQRYMDYLKIGYCTISYRSGKFAQRLKRKGIVIHNLRGGMLGWVHAGGKIFISGQATRQIHVYGRKWDLAPKAYIAIY